MKTKTITAKTPEALARTLGLRGLEAQEWQVQHALLKRLRQIVVAGGLTHAEVARRGGSSRTRVTSILNGNLDDVSSDLLISALGRAGVSSEGFRVAGRLGGVNVQKQSLAIAVGLRTLRKLFGRRTSDGRGAALEAANIVQVADELEGAKYHVRMRLNRAMIYVKDINRMAAFYGGTLGLKPIEATRLENWVEFEAGRAKLALHAIPSEISDKIAAETSQNPREDNPIKLCFEVDDVASEVRRLESLGVLVLQRPWGSCDGIDPEGNVFGLESANR